MAVAGDPPAVKALPVPGLKHELIERHARVAGGLENLPGSDELAVLAAEVQALRDGNG